MAKEERAFNYDRPDISPYQATANVWSRAALELGQMGKTAMSLAPLPIATKTFFHENVAAQEAGQELLKEFLPFANGIAEDAGCIALLDHHIDSRRAVFPFDRSVPMDIYQIQIHRGEKVTRPKDYIRALQEMYNNLQLHHLFSPKKPPVPAGKFDWLIREFDRNLRQGIQMRLAAT
mgnify:CR=1 FL=1